MRVIKAKERANGMKYCTYCKECGNSKISAIYRDQYHGGVKPISLACEDHKGLLVDGSKPIERKDRKDRRVDLDEDYSEADYQTWLRL